MDPETEKRLRDTFGDPIDTYTDADALADGVLVDIGHLALHHNGRPVNRVTGGLMADLAPFLNETTTLTSVLRTKLRYAYYKGDIWQVPPGLWLIENELGGWTLMRPEDY